MRKISYVVIHHSVTPRDLPIAQSVRSFDNSHGPKGRGLHKTKSSLGHYCAYHYVISGNGEMMRCRADDEVGYHASDLKINNESLGICLTGNFDVEFPSEKQIQLLKDLILVLDGEYGDLKVIGHRQVPGVTKSCPGKNFTDKMLKSLTMNNLLNETILLLKTLWPKVDSEEKVKIGEIADRLRDVQRVLGLEVTPK